VILPPFKYPEGTIAITAAGCVLPDALNLNQFWENLLNGRRSMATLPPSRWDPAFYVAKEPHEAEMSASSTACYVNDSLIADIEKELGLGLKDHSRLELMTLKAFKEAWSMIDPSFVKHHRIAMCLGAMAQDDEMSWLRFLDRSPALVPFLKSEGMASSLIRAVEKELESLRFRMQNRSHVRYNSAILRLIREELNVSAEGLIIDAACASSLASLNVGIQLLKSGEADTVITGGIESNLSPESFVIFSTLGLLSSGSCYPFDKRSDGMCQGEGTVILLLHRIEDAIEEGIPIWGVIRSSSGNSSGNDASLFSPSLAAASRLLKSAIESTPVKFAVGR